MSDLRPADAASSTRRGLLRRLALWLGLPATLPAMRGGGDARRATPARVVERQGWFLDARDR
jgi:hypothetical protein